MHAVAESLHEFVERIKNDLLRSLSFEGWRIKMKAEEFVFKSAVAGLLREFGVNITGIDAWGMAYDTCINHPLPLHEGIFKLWILLAFYKKRWYLLTASRASATRASSTSHECIGKATKLQLVIRNS